MKNQIETESKIKGSMTLIKKEKTKMQKIAEEKEYPYCFIHDVIYNEYCPLCEDDEDYKKTRTKVK